MLQGSIYLLKIVKILNFLLFEHILKSNLFLWFKAVFSASLLQFSVSHDPSEIILICCSNTFIIIINVENSCAASHFCGISGV